MNPRNPLDDLDDEIRDHIERETQENVEKGMAHGEARRRALIKFGNLALAKEDTRRVWVPRLIDEVCQDMRYALRSFRKAPSFAAVAVLTLALGIGANTAMYAVARAVLLDPLPYPDASRLVAIWEDASRAGSFPQNTLAPANYVDWKAQHTTLEGMAALASRSVTLTGVDVPERLSGQRVTHDFFDVLGVAPLLGRTFTADEDRPGRSDVAVISHSLWQERFASADTVVGQTILLDGMPHTVVGVMPPGFDYPEAGTRVWTPMAFTPEQAANRGFHYLRAVARLRPDTRLEQAREEMETIARRLEEAYPETNTGIGVRVNRLRDEVVGETRTGLLLLLLIVGCVLLIASANLANLLLGRAVRRRREFGVRVALGAGRGRLLRQLLAEHLLLSLTGALLGAVLATWSLPFLSRLVPADLTSARLTVDAGVLAVTAVLCALTAVLFGMLPARVAWRVGVAATLKHDDGRTSAHGGMRSGLIVWQTAFAVVLVVAAGLIGRSFLSLRAIDPGFRADGVLTLRTALPLPRYADAARRTAFYRDVLERVQALPGVTAAGYTSWLPYTNWGGATDAPLIEGQPEARSGGGDANIRLVTPGYFPAMGMRLVRGRLPTDADGEQTERVAVINETMARRFWPDRDPLASRMQLCAECPWTRIVGIVADIHQLALDVEVRPEYYLPYRQVAHVMMFALPQDLAIRASVDPASLVAPVRDAVWSVDAQQPIAQIQVLSDYYEADLAPRRFLAQLIGGFAGLALVLAALGIYGVLSYVVVQRRREIGLRLALGAPPGEVVRLVVSQGLWPTLGGLAVGVTAALASSHLIASLLYGVPARDATTFGAAVGVLLVASVLACWRPAHRAAHVDPLAALRVE